MNTPHFVGNEAKYLLECVESGWISSEGPFVERFEAEMAAISARKFGVAVANGTAALDIAISSLNIKPGDEVIMPSFTIISCVQQLLRAGAVPVFIDSNLETWNMDVTQIEKKITNKTKAIMAVHIYGLTVDLDPIIHLCNKYNLYLIEDAAQAIGIKYKNRICGSFGDVSTYSFYPNKHITTGEGGMCLTNNSEIFEKFKSLRNLCFQPEKRFVHDELGWNYRMTNLQAAVGLAQLEYLPVTLKRKREIGSVYNQELREMCQLKLPLANTSYCENGYWVFGVLIDPKIGNAQKFQRLLASEGIGTRPFFYPLHKQPVLKRYGNFDSENLQNSEYLYEQGLYLPSGVGLTSYQQDRVISVLKKILA